VAFLLEQGAAELAAPRLQRRMATVGMSLEVSVAQEPLAVGTALEVVVRLVGVGRERGTFVFDIEVKHGDRLVASGRHVRKVVQAGA
jgi:predicted thioesterase